MTYLLFRSCIPNFNIFYHGNRRRNKPINFGMFGIFQVCVSSKFLHFSVGRKQPFAWILCNIPEVQILKFQTVVFTHVSHPFIYRICELLLKELLSEKKSKDTHYCPLLFESFGKPFFSEIFCRMIWLILKTRIEMKARTVEDQKKVCELDRASNGCILIIIYLGSHGAKGSNFTNSEYQTKIV